MAERITYGKTWWGQQWLNALTSIDMANRLPRGKTYANKGAVQGLTIANNQISASIKGSAPRPYRTKLTVQLFTEGEKESLLTEIRENPAILAQLLNRQLPPELIEFANRQGTQLFPHSFRDLIMGCSCPDEAVPCKHLAAVIYVVANEIDRNPFQVFLLKGLDILAELQKGQPDSVTGSMNTVLSFHEIGTDDLPDDEDWRPNDKIRAGIDFATIPSLADQLLGLLSIDVTFTKSDFHKSLTKAYKLFSKPLAEKPFIQSASVDEPHPDPSDSIELQLDEVMKVKKISMFSEHGDPRSIAGFTMSDLTNWLDKLTEANWPEMSDSVRALYLTRQFAAALLRRGAIVPQLLRVGPTEDQYRVRWLPATLNETIKDLTSQLATQIPPTLLTVRWQKEWLALPDDQQVLTLCSLFLRRIIKPNTIELWERWPLEDADRLFFGVETLRFEGFGRKEMPLAIQLWLNDFFLTHKRFVPILAVEDSELGDEFRISLLIRDREATDTAATPEQPIPLAELLTKKKHERIRMAVLQDLLVLSRHFPDLAKLTKIGAPSHLAYSPDQFVQVLLETLPRMQLLGIALWLPKSLQHWVRPQVGARLKAKVTDKNAFMRLEDMLTFDWQIALGDEMVGIKEFQKLVSTSKGLVKIKDQYVLIDPAELTKLYKQLENPPELTGSDLLKAALAEEYKGARIGISAEVRKLVKQFTDSEAQPLPDALNATLRPYQQRGYDWLVKNTSLGMGSLLADDMGLGKTLQIIALLLKFKQEGRFKKQKGLVVLPTTLLTNWQKEIARFAPDLIARVYHGSNRKLPAGTGKENDYDLLLTTYGVIRSDLDTHKK